MTLFDLEELVNYSMEMGNYANSIQITRVIEKILRSYESNHDQVFPLAKRLQKLKAHLYQLNNAYLKKYERQIGTNLILTPYLVNKELKKAKNQPIFVRDGSVHDCFHEFDMTKYEWLLTETCKKGRWYTKNSTAELSILRCRHLHHANPYLRVGPFKEEQTSAIPYVVIFHDILSEHDISVLTQESQPKLSKARTFDSTGGANTLNDINSGKRRRTVHKAVQAWIQDVEWPDLDHAKDYVGKKFKRIINLTLWKLNRRISLATQLVTDTQTSGTLMQVTNYGLGGLCESHIDPHGIMETDEKYYRKRKPYLFVTGDILGTFMAWLSHTEEGGGTAYINPGHENLIMPQKGSAAFWYDLSSDGLRDLSTLHGGCPVLKGTKWIMNKWMYSFDNFRKFPCKLQRNMALTPPLRHHYL